MQRAQEVNVDLIDNLGVCETDKQADTHMHKQKHKNAHEHSCT